MHTAAYCPVQILQNSSVIRTSYNNHFHEISKLDVSSAYELFVEHTSSYISARCDELKSDPVISNILLTVYFIRNSDDASSIICVIFKMVKVRSKRLSQLQLIHQHHPLISNKTCTCLVTLWVSIIIVIQQLEIHSHWMLLWTSFFCLHMLSSVEE